MVSVPVIKSATELHEKLEAFRRSSTYSAERVRLSEVDAYMAVPQSRVDHHWQSQSNGDIARGDGLFFQVTGVRITPKDDATGKYDQPIFAEQENGFAALVYDKETGDILLDMKAEPGIDKARGHIAFAPTLQMSNSRLKIAAKNKADKGPAMLGALVGLGLDVDKATYISQDGNRFFGKRNGYEAVGVPNKAVVEEHATPSMLWTNAAYLADAQNLSDCNSHLAQCIGLHALKSMRGA